LRGWLGPHSIEEIMDTMQFEGLFSCHLHRGDDSSNQDIVDGKIPICRGFLASASASCKLFGQNRDYGKKLRQLQDQITEEDQAKVLTKWDFREHHDIRVV